MRSLFLLRVYALLKKLIGEVHRTADALEYLARIESARWDLEQAAAERELTRRARGPRHTEFTSFDPDEAERRWRKEVEAREAGVELEDKVS